MKRILHIYNIPDQLGLVLKMNKMKEGFAKRNCVYSNIGIVKNTGPIKIVQFVLLHINFLRKVLSKNYDIVYIRHKYNLLLIYILCYLLKINTQLELNGNENNEFRKRNYYFRSFLSNWSLCIAMKSACRVHAASEELAELYRARYNRETVYNGNFVVDEYCDKDISSAKAEVINLVFMGHVTSPRYGFKIFIDKIVNKNKWLMENCHIHIIGENIDHLKKCIIDTKVENIIIFHGRKNGYEKKKIISKMHIGIGPLNLDTINLKEATPIKVGEFLYSGLPVIIGYNDCRISDDSRLALKINLNQDPGLLQEKVNNFIKYIKMDKKIHQKAHLYAKKNMLVDNYIEKILNYNLDE